MSHHVAVRLPDGRQAVADYRQPITHVMQRIHHRSVSDPLNRRGHGTGSPDDLADYALIAEWLDHCPEQQCPPESVMSPRGDADCTHGPAEPGPYKPPPYKRPVLDGLW